MTNDSTSTNDLLRKLANKLDSEYSIREVDDLFCLAFESEEICNRSNIIDLLLPYIDHSNFDDRSSFEKLLTIADLRYMMKLPHFQSAVDVDVETFLSVASMSIGPKNNFRRRLAERLLEFLLEIIGKNSLNSIVQFWLQNPQCLIKAIRQEWPSGKTVTRVTRYEREISSSNSSITEEDVNDVEKITNILAFVIERIESENALSDRIFRSALNSYVMKWTPILGPRLKIESCDFSGRLREPSGFRLPGKNHVKEATIVHSIF